MISPIKGSKLKYRFHIVIFLHCSVPYLVLFIRFIMIFVVLMEWNNLCHHQYKTFGSASYVLCEARIIESVISNRIIENGNPVTTDAVCKLVKPPAIVIATEMAPISNPQITLCFTFDSRYLLLPCQQQYVLLSLHLSL